MKVTYHKDDDMDFDPVRESKGMECGTAILIMAACACGVVYGIYEFFVWLF